MDIKKERIDRREKDTVDRERKKIDTELDRNRWTNLKKANI